MANGPVANPVIIALRDPILGKSSHHIDVNTLVEIKSGTSSASIYFTTDGTAPDPFRKSKVDRTTIKYKKPFLLDPGKRTVRALAVAADRIHESKVVSKVFQVDWAPPYDYHVDQDREDNDFNFIGSDRKKYRPHATPTRHSHYQPPNNKGDGQYTYSQGDSAYNHGKLPQGHQIQPGTHTNNYGKDIYAHQTRSPRADRILDQPTIDRLEGRVHRAWDDSSDYDPFVGSRTITVPLVQTGANPRMQLNGTGAEPDFVNKRVYTAEDIYADDGISDPQYWIDGKPFQSGVAHDRPLKIPVLSSQRHASTQTTGLSYPTQREMREMEDAAKELKELKKMLSAKESPLRPASSSPVKGYWPKQMECICQHFKEFASNHDGLKSSLGHQKLTKINSVTVFTNEKEVSLVLNFRVRPNLTDSLHRSAPSKPKGRVYITPDSNRYPGATSSESEYSLDSEDIAKMMGHKVVKKTKKKGEKKKAKPVKKKTKEEGKSADNRFMEKLPVEDRLLLKEMLPINGNPDEVQQLLDEGADANLVDEEGVPVLTLAAVNGHAQCIPLLVKAGAKVNRKFGRYANTALHHAVYCGPSARDGIQALLDAGADFKLANAKGVTPSDLAAKRGHGDLVACFNARVGHTLMDRLARARLRDGDYQPRHAQLYD